MREKDEVSADKKDITPPLESMMPSRMEETRGRTEQAMPVHLGDPPEAQEEKYLYTHTHTQMLVCTQRKLASISLLFPGQMEGGDGRGRDRMRHQRP